MAIRTPIFCRMCGKQLGVVRGFEGRVFTPCVPCEKALKATKRRATDENQGNPRSSR